MIRIRFDGRSVGRFLSARLTGLPWLWRQYTPAFCLISAAPGYLERVTPDDGPAPTRRERRVPTGAVPTADAPVDGDSGVLTMPPDAVADASPSGTSTAPVEVPAPSSTLSTVGLTPESPGTATGLARTPVTVAPGVGGTALAWIDEAKLGRIAAPQDLAAAATPYVTVDADLLTAAPRRSPFRAGVVVPTLVVVGLMGAYSGTTLLWPLHAVTPTIEAVEVQPIAAPAAVPVWPAEGSAAEGVGGVTGVLASSADPESIASITKLVTALVVLEEMPLNSGEQGPEFEFTSNDRAKYRQYLRNGESAIDVPAGGSLTQYQMLEGMLVGSANNYADRLAQTLWPSDAVFAAAANAWLTSHGVPGVVVYEPTGMDERNTASAEALIRLAQKVLEHPVLAEIVKKQAVDLPGAGHVENTNNLLADPGVLGLKTGTLDASNLLSAKDVTIGDTTVRLYASVLGQPDDAARLAASRAIYAQLEQELQLKPSVTAGTVVGTVETRWGDRADVVTSEDASVILWNGGTGTVDTSFDLGDSRDEGDAVGSLTVKGPLDDDEVEVELTADVSDPSPWWRLTHPLELFGLN